MSKVINIENGEVLEINTEVLEISAEETIDDLYYHPATESNSKGIPFDKIKLVLEESAGAVRVKPEYTECYAKALDHWLAWRHGTASKPDLMDSSQPSPVYVDDAAINEVNDLIYRVCGYISMNYMKNIRKAPQRFSSEEMAFASHPLKDFNEHSVNAFQTAFSKVIKTKVVDGVANYEKINVKALTEATEETIRELYYNQAYSKVRGVSSGMIKLVLEESNGKVWVKPEHERHFRQALELWLARRYGADFKYSSSGESDVRDQDTADARVLIYQLCERISEDYMEKIGAVPVASAY